MVDSNSYITYRGCMMSFEENQLWSPRVASEFLESQLPGFRDWVSWLANDRRKEKPILPFVKFAGYSVLYQRPDVEQFIEQSRLIAEITK